MHWFLETHLSLCVLKGISLHFYAIPVWFIGFFIYTCCWGRKSQQSKLKSDGFSALILCKYPFPAFLLMLPCWNLFLSRRALGGGWSKTFSWFDSLFFLSLFSIFLFISAASDHYLIGNNITVAVLGIVIPIGEYCWLPDCVVFAFCLPASPSSLLQVCLSPACCVCFVFNVCECEYEVMCLHACAWVLGCLRFHLAD